MSYTHVCKNEFIKLCIQFFGLLLKVYEDVIFGIHFSSNLISKGDTTAKPPLLLILPFDFDFINRLCFCTFTFLELKIDKVEKNIHGAGRFLSHYMYTFFFILLPRAIHMYLWNKSKMVHLNLNIFLLTFISSWF